MEIPTSRNTSAQGVNPASKKYFSLSRRAEPPKATPSSGFESIDIFKQLLVCFLAVSNVFSYFVQFVPSSLLKKKNQCIVASEMATSTSIRPQPRRPNLT
jgi:hypothetical protein